MTRLQALKELARKVEVGEDDAWHGCGYVFGVELGSYIQGACNGSLDAAQALHEAVLPRCTRSVDATAPECGITVELHPVDGKGNPVPKPIISAVLPCESRAWLLDILKALIAQEEGE
ncbi:hypothetical protein [Phaeobacter italicus]|uniref:hypothetical protein n=1 Tax=Phaeobacter italicus TaxID=481446 RepID=UPI002FDECF4F